MRITLSKGAVIGAAALLGVTVLAGCSSSSDTSNDESTSSETTSDESMDGGNQMLPPVIVEPGQTEANATVGDFIDIVVEEIVGTTIATDNPEILKVSQAYDDGSALFNPGAEALAPGTAIITVTTPDNTSYDITVTVTE
jgi:outer membrane lipoprotein SlyB